MISSVPGKKSQDTVKCYNSKTTSCQTVQSVYGRFRSRRIMDDHPPPLSKRDKKTKNSTLKLLSALLAISKSKGNWNAFIGV